MRRLTHYEIELDASPRTWIHVSFTTVRRCVADYSVVLLIEEREQAETVRVYDGAHAVNEMHRYTQRSGKQPGEVVDNGDLGEGMRGAIAETEAGYRTMIEGWRSK